MGRATIRAEITGLGPILAKLDAVSLAVRKTIVRKAVAAAAAPILAEMKARVRRDTSTLWKSLAIRVTTSRRTGAISVIIGPRTKFVVIVTLPSGATVKRWATKYAHLVEFGHRGPHPAPPFPFERPAWDAGKARAEATLRQTLLEGIEAAAK